MTTFRFFHHERSALICHPEPSALLDNSAGTVVKYAYDAFGNCKVLLDTAGLSTVNPIRYRSYYYDHETGMYYLGSRYYNPQWRRFISPSTSAINPSVVNGLNGYAFAGNNPIDFAVHKNDISTVGTVTHSIASGANYISAPHRSYGSSFNLLGALSAFSNAFGFFDQWSGYISGGIDGAFGFLGKKGFGFGVFQPYSDLLSNFGKGMAWSSAGLSWINSTYSNFTNPNYSSTEVFLAGILDAGYYYLKAKGTLLASEYIGMWAIKGGLAIGAGAVPIAGALGAGFTGTLITGMLVGGTAAIVIGGVGAIVVYCIGEGLDWLYENLFKKPVFE